MSASAHTAFCRVQTSMLSRM